MNAHTSVKASEAEVRRFFQVLHDAAAKAFAGVDNPGLLNLCRLFPSDNEDNPFILSGRFRIGDVDRMTAVAIADADAGFNVYVEARTVREDTPKRGTFEYTVGSFGLVIDADGDKGRDASALPLAPSLVVESSPGNRHYWYFFECAQPHAVVQPLGVAIKAGTGGDDNTGVVSQPYRVAGTPNYPTPRKVKRGRVVVPTRVLGTGRSYLLEELQAAFPAVARASATDDPIEHVTDDAVRFKLFLRCSDDLRRALAEQDVEDRSKHAFHVIRWLKDLGFKLGEAIALIRFFPNSAINEKYDDRLEVEVKRAWDKPKKEENGPSVYDPGQHTNGQPVISQDAVALTFADLYADTLRYCHTSGAWFVCNDGIWRRDEKNLAFQFCRLTARQAADGAKSAELKEVGKIGFAVGVERFAQSDIRLAASHELWDQDPMLIGTPGGVVDLRTGQLLPARPDMFITKVTAVAPADTADCPRWRQFLDEATDGDAEMIRFLRAWFGYSLTGVTREHVLVFVYGPGGNGKSVWLSVLMGILADYARTASMDVFVASRSDRHPTELAALCGARAVAASETEEGRAWAESRIKSLTGGDRIAARFMRQDFFEFRPQFKLTVVGNHKPILRNIDEAARRRFRIVPFTRKPPNPDPQLENKLIAEFPGILRWAIEGCLDWQANGLVIPASVASETDAYFADQDVFGQWIEESCRIEPGNEYLTAMHAELFGSWTEYARRMNVEPGSSQKLTDQMRKRGLSEKKTKNGKQFLGIQLLLRAVSWTEF